MLQPLPEFLENAAVDVDTLAEALRQYITEAEEVHEPVEPDQVLVVEDCKRFYLMLTGTWWNGSR